jgi:heme/copper-type cytochrome/quinol oxidase subunit 2
MVDINIDGCECTCNTARIIEQANDIDSSFGIKIILIFLIVIVMLLGLYTAWRRLRKKEDDDVGKDTYY